MEPVSAISSYVVRVEAAGATKRIRVQNLRTGEMLEFRNWREFVRYAEAQRRAGTLK